MNNQRSIPFYRSAGLKISACVVGGFGLLAVTLDLVFDDGLERITSQLVAAQVSAEVETFGSSLSPQVAFEQQPGAEKILERMIESSNGAISRAVVVDADGKPFAAWGAGDLQALYGALAAEEPSEGARIKVANLALADDPKVGAIAVEWSTRHILQLVKDTQRRLILATTAIGLFAAASVLLAFRLIVSKPLARLAGAVERLRHREYDVEVPDSERRDEFGPLSRSLQSFQSDLHASVELDTRARETSAAFDATSAPLMVADSAGLIRTVNPAAQELMTKYREAIAKVFPGFDPTRICGQPLHRLYPDYCDQSHGRIAEPSPSVRLKFGDGRMKLQIQPIHRTDRTSAAFALEWQDVSDEFRNSSRIAAIERTQLCAEFGVNGHLKTCNDKFRDSVGAGSPRIADFLRSAAPDGPTGQQIVERALRGEKTEGLFRISSCSGRPVVADGSINAMRDTDSTIHRILLVARDVTEVQLDLEQERLERERSEKERTEVVSALRDGMKTLSTGDLNAEIEMRFAERFDEVRRDYNATVQMLQAAMMEMSQQAGRIRSKTRDISATTELLSQRSESSAATLDQAAAALNQLTGGVANAAESARDVSALVADARTDAEQSGDVLLRTVKAMDEIAISSEKAASIIKVIDEIAFQTNLLALNAGVEAARAGDAGRGFAVVASEVRALAQRSSDAARQINTLIGQSRAQVKSGVALVGETGEALQRIVGWIENISESVIQIAASAKNQTKKLEDINGAVNKIDGATKQNTARLEEATAVCLALIEDTSSLIETTARFRIPRDDTALRLIKPKEKTFDSVTATAAETWTDF